MKSVKAKKISFALSLTQGFAGGLLGGFVYLIIALSKARGVNFNWAVFLASYFLLSGSILGLIKATIMWAVFRLTGITLRTAARVAIASIVSSLLLACTGLYFEWGEFQFTIWLMFGLSIGTPVALLVGSQTKPWELFTFGSIAAGEVDHRSGSRSIIGTLGSLPLRFLGIGTCVVILLTVASEMQPVDTPSKATKAILLSAVFTAYPAFSSYITFRSPRKVVLLALGIIINTPIAFVALFAYSIYNKANWMGETQLFVSMLCGSFVVAWLVFLITRLSARLRPIAHHSISNNKSIAAAPNLDHQCLGSRFEEWEHAA